MRTLNWITRHANADAVRFNITTQDSDGDVIGKDIASTDPNVLAAAAALEAAVCAAHNCTIPEPPKKIEPPEVEAKKPE